MADIEKIVEFQADGVVTNVIDINLNALASREIIGRVKNSEGVEVDCTQLVFLNGTKMETITDMSSLLDSTVDAVDSTDSTLGEVTEPVTGGLFGG